MAFNPLLTKGNAPDVSSSFETETVNGAEKRDLFQAELKPQPDTIAPIDPKIPPIIPNGLSVWPEQGSLNQTRESEANQLRKKIAEFKAGGYELSIGSCIMGVSLGLGYLKAMASPSTPTQIRYGYPSSELDTKYNFTKSISADLSNTADLVVNPFWLEALPIEGKKFSIKLYNLLESDAVPIHEEIVDLNLDEAQNPLSGKVLAFLEVPHPSGITSVMKRLAGAVEQELEHSDYQQLLLDSIVPADPPPIRVDLNCAVPEPTLENLKALIDLGWNVRLYAYPEGVERDPNPSGGGSKQGLQVVTLSRQKLEDLKGAIIIDGALWHMELEKSGRLFEYALTVDNTKHSPPITSRTNDKYGNIHYSIKDSVRTSIQIYPRSAFSTQEGAETIDAAVNFDTTAYGGGDLEGFLYQRTERPITFAGPGDEYRVYAAIGPSVVLRDFVEPLESVSKGIASIERLFAATPGEVVHGIMIVNAYTENAYFDPLVPDMIYCHDEALRVHNEERAQCLGRHEAIHLFDERLGISRGNLFTGWYKSLQRDSLYFFEKITESNFLSAAKDSCYGHPWDDQREFLASLVNTFSDRSAIKDTILQDPQFKELYLDSLKILKVELERCVEEGKLSADVPILTKISKFICLYE